MSSDDETVLRPGGDSGRGGARFAPGDLLAGRFRIVAPLGRGGMGEVYRAEDTRLDQPVALKFLPETGAVDARTLDRLVSEVRIGRDVSHPNVCRLYDLVESGPLRFIAMEFVDGEDLASLLRRIGRLPADKALALTVDLAAGLAAAHDRGVVHRDLKPANVMIDGRGRARITDFGLALIKGESAGDWAGTPAYMAPEQLAGRPADARSDLYALGLVAWEMFTGRRLFTAGDLDGLRREHDRPKAAPSTLVSDIDPAVDRVILSCLEEAPDRRPASSHAILAALPAPTPGAPAPAPGTSRRTPSSGARDRRSIAVLPFEDLGAAADDEHFSLGLAEEITSDLAKVEGLRVTSRGSAMRFKGSRDLPAVARELQVAFVLTGSVRKAGRELRVTASLVDGGSDTIVWSEKFRGGMDDVFDIQETVARTVAEQLKGRLTDEDRGRIAERPIPNMLAYEYFLRARRQILKFTSEGIDAALALLDQGLGIVGPNVLIYSAMAYAHWQRANASGIGDGSDLARAEALAERIFELEPDSPHAHRIVGLAAMLRGRVREGVLALEMAHEGDPTDVDTLRWLTAGMAYVNQVDRAGALAETLLRVDPLGGFTLNVSSWAALVAGDVDRAVALSERGWELEPDNLAAAVWVVYLRAVARRPDAAAALADMERRMPAEFLTALARFIVRAAAGDREGARQALTPDVADTARLDLHYAMLAAEGLALLGDEDRALEFFEAAIDLGFLAWAFLERHWMFESIRSRPRFQAGVARARERSAAIGRELAARRPAGGR